VSRKEKQHEPASPASATEYQQVQCRKCGCRHFRVGYMKHKPRGIMRKRICRHCGTPLITWERAT
jgi:hypothetical protein